LGNAWVPHRGFRLGGVLKSIPCMVIL